MYVDGRPPEPPNIPCTSGELGGVDVGGHSICTGDIPRMWVGTLPVPGKSLLECGWVQTPVEGKESCFLTGDGCDGRLLGGGVVCARPVCMCVCVNVCVCVCVCV